jgi:hypothetical protein
MHSLGTIYNTRAKRSGGSGIEYGWARMAMNGASGNTFTLVDYA